ncbi:MAG TPA: hypothetical protein ENN80_01175, partial [Candidatus Hydrogenedentes bacterium]|nr:hypothetical protein [Candidatus Hydrogenedentota bacterium]
MAVATVMVLLSWAFYGQGTGIQAVLLIGALYLFIQILDWLRPVAVLLVPVVLGLVLAALLVHIGGLDAWISGLREIAGGHTEGVLLLVLLLWAPAMYALSLGIVKMARHGQRLALFSIPEIDLPAVIPAATRRKSFRSQLAAQTWLEVRRAGLFMPLALVASWLLANGVRWLVLYSKQGGKTASGHLHYLNSFWLFEVTPLIALVLAAFALGLRATSRPRHGARPASFRIRQPISKAQMAQAHLIASGISVVSSLAVVGIVSTWSFLFAHDGHIAALLSEALAHGETHCREIAALLAGPLLLVGGAAWVIVGLSNRFGIWMLALTGLPALLFLLAVSPYADHSFLEGPGVTWACFGALLPVLFFLGSLIIAGKKHLLSNVSLIACALLWFAFALATYPFALTHPRQNTPVLVLISLALGALIVLPYVATTLVLGARDRGQLARENPRQHRFGGRVAWLATAAIVILLAFLAWLRWPAEPAWKDVWRADGKPTSLDELDTWYEHVPPEQNLANRYLDASKKAKELGELFAEQVEAERKAAPPAGDSRTPRDPWANVLGFGTQFPNKDLAAPLPPEVWKWTRRYWDTIGSKVAPDLHAAAHSGLTNSRYPANMRAGYNVRLDYLARLRNLARI